MTADDDRFTWALAHYLRNQTYLTHADRDAIGKAFRAGWEARIGADDIDGARDELRMLRDLGQQQQGPGAARSQARDRLASQYLELLTGPGRSDLAHLALVLANTALLADWTPPAGDNR